MAKKRIGSRWLWAPLTNAYFGFANESPQPCKIVAYTTFTLSATTRGGQIGPYDYVVELDDGGKVYAFDVGLTPLETVSALSVRRSES